MVETTVLLAAERWAPVPAPDPAPLVKQVAMLWQENAALRAEHATLQAKNTVLHELGLVTTMES
jgi:hypothetical protein